MSLSSVVSTLVRASMGSSVSSSVGDEDLDAHVRDLLIKDAKKRAEKYSQQGIRAYLASNISDSNAPKANKRFLSSIIRSTDDHNKTILRAQAAAAEEIKRERRETERREKRARAEEAAAAERDRLRRGVNETESWDRWNGRTGDRKRKSREWETWDGKEDSDGDHRSRRRHRHRHRHRDDGSKRHRRHRSRSRSASSSRAYSTDRHRNSKRDDERRTSRRSDRKHSSRTRSHSLHSSEDSRHRSRHDSRQQKRSLSPAKSKADDEPSSSIRVSEQRQLDDDEALVKPFNTSGNTEMYSLKKASSSSSTLSSGMDMSSSRSPTPGPEPAPHVPSKMDKYFEESYDPRLDVAPLTVPQVPATGLINNTEFEGWDAMLELLRQRREDKDEKRKLERMGYKKDEIKKAIATGSLSSVSDRWNSGGTSVMNIEYKKRGTVREWDLGKEGF